MSLISIIEWLKQPFTCEEKLSIESIALIFIGILNLILYFQNKKVK